MAVLAGLAGYLCLAQPGLCPYWMIGDLSLLAAADAEHTHQPAAHHHDQSRDYFLTATAPAVPQVVLSAAALLALLAAAARLEIVADRRLTALPWRPLPLFPPPRSAAG